MFGDTPAGPTCPLDAVLMDTMHTYWTNFARTGDPNQGGGQGGGAALLLPHWPRYSSGVEVERGGAPPPQLMVLDHVCAATAVVRAPFYDLHDLWLEGVVAKLQLLQPEGEGATSSGGGATSSRL